MHTCLLILGICPHTTVYLVCLRAALAGRYGSLERAWALGSNDELIAAAEMEQLVSHMELSQVPTLLALLVQEYKY